MKVYTGDIRVDLLLGLCNTLILVVIVVLTKLQYYIWDLQTETVIPKYQ